MISIKANLVTLIVLLVVSLTQSKVAVLFGEEIEDCTEGGKAKYLDFTNLEIEYLNDTCFVLNGKIT
jgi:hypothetical protein